MSISMAIGETYSELFLWGKTFIFTIDDWFAEVFLIEMTSLKVFFQYCFSSIYVLPQMFLI
jgi:hypothetical protein